MFWRETGKKLVLNQCAYRATLESRSPIDIVLNKKMKAKHIFYSLLTGSDININSEISKSVVLPHPNGIVIHAEAEIGDSCMIMQQVTIGMISKGAPKIGKNTYIGAGAKVLGDICVGNNVRIGANAVVLQDLPDDCTAVGVPARIIENGQR